MNEVDPTQSIPANDDAESAPCEPRLENCQAIMVGLTWRSARRFVLVRRDRPSAIAPLRGDCVRVRDLRPGDEVMHKGRRVVVRSVEVYE
ncbi:MAG: hypothetical protein KDA41_08465 [Planctomycetales bacterium]|nr:hypothetical protein [Planctomycetales bacterium]